MLGETPKHSFGAYQGDDGETHITEAGPNDIITLADIIAVLRAHPEDWHEFDVKKLTNVDLGDHPEEVHVFIRREKRTDGSIVTPTFVGPDDVQLPEAAWQNIMEQVGPLYTAEIQVRATARRRQS